MTETEKQIRDLKDQLKKAMEKQHSDITEEDFKKLSEALLAARAKENK